MVKSNLSPDKLGLFVKIKVRVGGDEVERDGHLLPNTPQQLRWTLPTFNTQNYYSLIVSHIVCMKPSVFIYVFFIFVLCVCVCWQTPVAVKLPWLSLKQRPNEIWMCREWIRVMEWAKYYLHCVSAILSWGDRYSVLRKVKSTLQVQHIYQQADSTLLMFVTLKISGILDIVGKIGNLPWGVDHEHDLILPSPTTVPAVSSFETPLPLFSSWYLISLTPSVQLLRQNR